jgi:hypothetical protein
MTATDRDLLALEPNLFRDMGWLGQRLVSGTGSIAGTTLTLASSDVGLDDAAIGAGHVALVDQTPYEVIERLSATELTVSRLRAEEDGDVVPPTPVSGKPVAVYSFAPQIALARAGILRLLRIDPGAPAEGVLTESSVLDAAALRWVVTLEALRLVFTGAATVEEPDVSEFAAAKAAMYEERAGRERQRLTFEIDTDGDGQPNALRRLNTAHLVRG